MLIPEVNLGQLLMLIRARYLIDAVGYDRVRGKPFRIAEIIERSRARPRGGIDHDRDQRPRPATTRPSRPSRRSAPRTPRSSS